jgi:hypothetical protein
MPGQQNFLYLTQENYFDKFENNLLKYADLLYLNKKFGVGEDVDKDKVRHSQLFYNILCTDECELIDWVWKKINGDLEELDYSVNLKDFKIFETPYGHQDSDEISQCCDWAVNEW